MEVSLMFICLSVSTTLGIVYYTLLFGYWRRRNVQTLSPNFLFGNLTEVIFGKVAFIDIFEKTYHEFKSKGLRYAGYYFMAKPILVVLDPKLIEDILVKDFGHFTDRPIYSNKEKDPMSETLFSMRGSVWRNMRNIVSPAFTTNKLKMMLEYFVKIGGNLTRVVDEACDNSKLVDIKDITNKYIIDVIATSFLGVQCNSLANQNEDFVRSLKKTMHGGIIQKIKVFVSFMFPSIISILGGRLIDKETSDFYMNLTRQTVKYREKNNVSKNDLIHLLIQLRNNIDIEMNSNTDLSAVSSDPDRKKLLSIEEIATQIFTFYATGSETTSSALAFCFFELVQNPETLGKLTKEIKQVLAKHKGEITYEALNEMSYMHMCIKETIRIYPAIPFLTRVCTKDWVIPGTDITITKGLIVQIPLLQIHHDPDYFPNPLQFDPERFSPENITKIQSSTYLPFGDGPHICIGMRIAVMKIKVALTILLKNYKFTLNHRTKIPLETDGTEFFFAIKSKIWMNVEKL